MTTEKNTISNDTASIEEAKKQRRREASRRYEQKKRSNNPERLAERRKKYATLDEESKKKILEDSRKRTAARREKYREKMLEASRNWYQKNKERRRLYNKEWMDAHKDYMAQWSATYRANHREELRAKCKKWREENPEKNALKARRYTAIKAGACGNHTIDDINRLKVLQNEKCAVCKSKIGKSYHVDHIVPLALKGSNNASNLQLLCSSCNLAKHAKHPVDFMQERGFLL